MSSSTRSPTDSGYRSTPRHTEENPYMFEDECEYGKWFIERKERHFRDNP